MSRIQPTKCLNEMIFKKLWKSLPGWVRSGVLGVASILLLEAIMILACSPASVVCRRIDAVVVALSTPKSLVLRPVFRSLEALLGVRRLAPEMVVVPPGVPNLLRALAWITVLLYWFIVGVVVHAIGHGCRRVYLSMTLVKNGR